MKIPVLYHDNYLIVCDKPVGIFSESPGLPDQIAEQYSIPVWPVHRLDRDTGGVIILARSPEICSMIQKQFLQHTVRKEYLAVISGSLSEPSGKYVDLLFHDKTKNKSFIVSRRKAGVKEAQCEWKQICSVFCGDDEISLVRVLLHTGRTHQIRVQFGSRSHPIVGDGRYGSRIKADAPALWSYRISFPHPCIRDCNVCVSSVPPSVFPWNIIIPEKL